MLGRLLNKLPPSARFARIHLPQGGRLFGTATSKAPSLRGLSPSGDWGSYPKYSCISAFFINSSFSRLFCTTPSVTASAVPPPSRREAFRHRHVKGSLREGAVAVGDWGSHPKYSCISAFFINSSFSRLCCTVCFCWSTRSTKAANWF